MLTAGATEYEDLTLLWFRQDGQALILFHRKGLDLWGQMSLSVEAVEEPSVRETLPADMRRALARAEAHPAEVRGLPDLSDWTPWAEW